MEENKKKIVRELIEKYFDKHDVSYCFEESDFVDDTFSSVEDAIQEICEEYNKKTL